MKRPHLVAFGECMLELKGTAFGAMQQGFGGDTLNAAVYAAREGSAGAAAPGLQVSYATALGDDALSDGLVARWQAEGVDTALVRRLPGRLPGLYLIEVDARGERRFSYWRDQAAARAHFDTPAADTPLEQAEPAIDLLFFSGISLAILPPAGRARLLGLAARLRARGAQVAFDNNHRPRLWPDMATARAAHEAALQVATVALLTLDDERLLWGCDSDAAALARTEALALPELVVKRGAQPTVVRGPDGRRHERPPPAVAQVVDTTAAGDAFAGTYLAQRLLGAAPADAAARANTVAAAVVQHPGAIIPATAMPGAGGSTAPWPHP